MISTISRVRLQCWLGWEYLLLDVSKSTSMVETRLTGLLVNPLTPGESKGALLRCAIPANMSPKSSPIVRSKSLSPSFGGVAVLA